MKASDYGRDIGKFLHGYEYQRTLTRKLDGLGASAFTQRLVNEIVLWKLDRYVDVTAELLREVDGLALLAEREHRTGESVLRSLLRVDGINLPMASALLRFRNSSVFQIIDRHAYRAVYGKPLSLHTKTPDNEKVSVYFDYIDQLWQLCDEMNLAFITIDRVLYVFDKRVNGRLSGAVSRQLEDASDDSQRPLGDVATGSESTLLVEFSAPPLIEGAVESAIRRRFRPPVVIHTLGEHKPFNLRQVDRSGIVLELGKGASRTPIPWDCLERIPSFLRGRGWVRAGGARSVAGEPGTLDEYLKQGCGIKRDVARWLAVVLLEADVIETNGKTRPLLLRLV